MKMKENNKETEEIIKSMISLTEIEDKIGKIKADLSRYCTKKECPTYPYLISSNYVAKLMCVDDQLPIWKAYSQKPLEYNKNETYLTAIAASKLLNCSDMHVVALINRKELRELPRYGKCKHRIPLSDILDYIKNHH